MTHSSVGLDYLALPNGPIEQSQKLASTAFGAKQTWFLVNGTTVGIHAAIMASCRPGDCLLLARNCHQSAFAAAVFAGKRAYRNACRQKAAQSFALCELLFSNKYEQGYPAFLPSSAHFTLMWCMSGCNTTYVQPERDDQLGIAHGVCPGTLQQSLEAAVAAGKQIKAVMVVSPTYFGAISDIKGQSAGHGSMTQDMVAHGNCRV